MVVHRINWISRTQVLVSGLLLAFAAASSAQTSVIREMSKNRSSIYVLYSGPETRAMAERLVLAVKDSRDYKENKR